jgi:hypothetical protein
MKKQERAAIAWDRTFFPSLFFLALLSFPSREVGQWLPLPDLIY